LRLPSRRWGPVFLTTFLASGVEAVEALTIVLGVGVGVVRGRRSPLLGVGAASVVLAGLVAVLAPALELMPIQTLRLVVRRRFGAPPDLDTFARMGT
jgi:uncharacterized membrane protein